MSWSNVHAALTTVLLAWSAWLVVTGWTPDDATHGTLPASVRANPASYHPVYVVYTGGGGGWSSGK